MRYSVHRVYVSGRDGEAGFDNLRDAERDFDDAGAEEKVVSAELLDNQDPENPVVVRSFDTTMT